MVDEKDKYAERRRVNSFDLSDKLRSLQRAGVRTPILHNSIYIPKYVGKDDKGNELYNTYDARGVVSVDSGQVIDSHGNVVDLAALEREAVVKLFSEVSEYKIQEVSEEKYPLRIKDNKK